MHEHTCSTVVHAYPPARSHMFNVWRTQSKHMHTVRHTGKRRQDATHTYTYSKIHPRVSEKLNSLHFRRPAVRHSHCIDAMQ